MRKGFLQIRSSVEKERTTINTLTLLASFFSIQTQHQTHVKLWVIVRLNSPKNYDLAWAGVILCVGASN